MLLKSGTNYGAAPRRTGRIAWIVSITTVFMAGGCGRPVNRTAERRIRDTLPDLIGSARQYRVHVDAAGSSAALGRLTNVTVDGYDIQMGNGLLVDHLHLEMKNVVANVERRRLRSVGSAKFTATIGEASIDEFLAGESPNGEPEALRNVHVRFRTNRVELSGERVVLGVGVPFRAYGPLRLAGLNKIEMDPSRLVVIGIPITGIPLNFLKRRFENGVDLSSLPVPVNLDSVRTENKILIITGSPDIQAMIQLRDTGGVP